MTMRLGLVWQTGLSAVNYRVQQPAEALLRRGNEIVAVLENGRAEYDAMVGCDAILVYRLADDATLDVIGRLAETGVAIVYDNDDDFLSLPDDHPVAGRLDDAIRQEAFDRTLRMARIAALTTVTTEPVARRYRDAGIERVEVVPNYLGYAAIRPPRPHDGLVIGWVAGMEHGHDAHALGIAEALERVLAKHDDVRVECIGVDLELSQRYRHDEYVPFDQLSDRVAGFDIGLAPLAATPFNLARSDIKVKEYAGCGVPWLASPVGPYAGLGEGHGGRLVEDGRWFEAVHRLVKKRRDRERLAAAGTAWARTQSIAWAYRRYEDIFAKAIERARAGSAEARSERVSS
jgi:glycosyltransferase involved in cell wall biosynthesis